jgi:hypothetical protein
MTPDARMDWFIAFLAKHYLSGAGTLDACCLGVLVLMMNTASMMYILGVARVDLHRWHVCIFCEVVFM